MYLQVWLFIASPVQSIVFAGFAMAAALSKYNLDRLVSLSIVNVMENGPIGWYWG